LIVTPAADRESQAAGTTARAEALLNRASDAFQACDGLLLSTT